MPNWVRNIITAKAETIEKIKEKYFENGELSFEKVIPMPKTLMLESGSRTDRAIYYAYSKKDEKEQEKIREILRNHKGILGEDYTKFITRFSKERIAKIEEFASEYEPSSQEKELGIETFEELGNTYINNIKEYGFPDWYDWRVENWGTKWDASQIDCNENSITFNTAWSSPSKILIALSKALKDDEIEVKFADEDYYSDNNGILHLRHGIILDYELNKGEDFSVSVWCDTLDYSEESPDIVDDMFE